MKQQSRRRSLSAAFDVAAAAVMMFGLSGVAVAQPPPRNQTDHFACYEATDTNPNAPITITLDDQFGTLTNVQAMTALEICNPTTKAVLGQDTVPINEDDLHLTFYELTQKLPTIRRRVVVNNQFGLQTLRTAAPRLVAVPTLKNGQGDERDLRDISHFTCYEASGKRVLVEADIDDQFQNPAKEILVHAPHFFCNPAAKTRGGVTTDIANDEEHLVCYKVTPSDAPSGVSSVTVENQFEGFGLTTPATFQVGPLHFLSVPSEKVSFTGSGG